MQDQTFRLEPETQGVFNVTCTTRFSTPVYGRLTFRSRREGGISAASLVFLLKSNVSPHHSHGAVVCHPVLIGCAVCGCAGTVSPTCAHSAV